MYRWLEVEHFRCFPYIRVEGLASINLVTGRNNVGKTALLEAFFIHSAATNLDSVIKVDSARGISMVRVIGNVVIQVPWDDLFYSLDIRRPLSLKAGYRDGRVRELRLRLHQPPAYSLTVPSSSAQESDPADGEQGVHSNIPPVLPALEAEYLEDGRVLARHVLAPSRATWAERAGVSFEVTPPPSPPPLPAYYLQARRQMSEEAAARRFSDLEVERKQDLVVETLRVIEPKLKRLTVLVRGQHAGIYGDVGLPQLVPLGLMGEGMAYLAQLALAMGSSQGGLVLIDEAENGVHHSVLRDLWRVIGHLARQLNVQVVATTHSYECIRAARDSLRAVELPMRLYRLDRVEDGIRVVSYDEDTLDAALQMELELR